LQDHPLNKIGLGDLALYIVQAGFSKEKMIYIPDIESDDGVVKVVYLLKDRKSRKIHKSLVVLPEM
jgi:hypothetical protein